MENNLKKVSIVMPAYNASHTVRGAICSILEQTYTNWELIVVDDGSTDNTVDLVHAFQDSRIRLVAQKNAGPAAARNRGLDEAIGSYICFMDADDLLHQEYIKRLIDIIEKNGADIAMCSYQKVTLKKQKNYEKFLARKVDESSQLLIWSAEECINSMFYKKEVMPYPFLKLFKRDIIGANRFPEDLKLGEDLEFNLKVLKGCDIIAVTKEVLYFHVENEGSITHNLNYSVAEKHFAQLYKMMNQETAYWESIEFRLFVVAYDFLCQATKREKKEKILFLQCRNFIKEHCVNVGNNRNTTGIVRIMARFSRISVPFTVALCRQGKKIKMKKAI
jgi:glycosyltransferase involved in cell wall biosynthesis